MCVLLDMYEERGEARGIEKGIAQGEARGIAKGISQGIEEINALYHCLLADNRMDDIQKQSWIQNTKKNCYRSIGLESNNINNISRYRIK